MTVLITGGSGQDGQYLAQHCLGQGATVIRTGRTDSQVNLDVASFSAVESLIRTSKPDYVFHFAADSRLAHEALLPNLGAISAGAVNILESCWRHCRGTRVFLPGSALQFENTGAPIDEATPFAATSAYAVARIQMTFAARYFRSSGLRCYVGYLFHHDSPLRSERHLSQRIASAAARIAAGDGVNLEIGSLSVEKEWVFAEDTVRAIWTLVNQDEYFEAAIGSGQAFPVQSWVEACFEAAGIDWNRWVSEIPGFRADFQRLVSNPFRIMRLGWKPTLPLRELATLMVSAQALRKR